MKNDHNIKCFYFGDILVVLLFVRMLFLSFKKFLPGLVVVLMSYQPYLALSFSFTADLIMEKTSLAQLLLARVKL